MSLLDLPPHKRNAILAEFGESANKWIEDYPALVRSCQARWQLKLLDIASEGLPINVIYYAETDDGRPVVVKLGYPQPEQITEMITLPLYNGHHAPRVLDCDREMGVILMERIVPGTTFRATASSIERSRMTPSLLRELPRALEQVDGLPTYDDWIERGIMAFRERLGTNHAFNEHLIRAQICYTALNRRYPGRWLLHGDLHHENILADEVRGWCAIDPKGVIGPLPMETGRFLHNFLEDEVAGAATIAETTVEALCEVLEVRYQNMSQTLDIPRADLVAAAYIDCVLSSCWTLTAGHRFEGMARVHATRQMLDQ